MNDNAKAWVTRLRSGEETQARQRLQVPRPNKINGQDDGTVTITRCCLGVACELYRTATGVGEWKSSESGSCDAFVVLNRSYAGKLPPEVVKWLGFTDEYNLHGIFEPGINLDNGVHVGALVQANDGGADFNEIANLIERYRDYLFTAEETGD